VPLAIFQGAHRLVMALQITYVYDYEYVTELHYITGKNHELLKIMKMQMLAILDETMLDRGNIRSLNLAVVMRTTIQVNSLLL
jgi:hypothetical protein